MCNPDACQPVEVKPFKIKGSDSYRYYCLECFGIVETRTGEEARKAKAVGHKIEMSSQRERTITERIVQDHNLTVDQAKAAVKYFHDFTQTILDGTNEDEVIDSKVLLEYLGDAIDAVVIGLESDDMIVVDEHVAHVAVREKSCSWADIPESDGEEEEKRKKRRAEALVGRSGEGEYDKEYWEILHNESAKNREEPDSSWQRLQVMKLTKRNVCG